MRYEPRTKEPLPSLEQINQIGDVVAKIAAVKPITQPEERVVVRAAGGIGGAKPKALIQIDNEQWIVKFYNGEPVDSPVVEHASMTLAAKAGIRVAQTQVLTLANSLHALAIRRFDRQGQRRIHAISAGTVLRATTPHVGQINEMGYPALALVLRRMGTTDNEENVADARELFRRMVFNILINNTDDHEKNHTILVVSPWKNGRYRLSPAYDVLPSNSRQGHQEFVCGDFTYEPTLENAMSQCMSFGLFPKEAALEIQRVIATVDLWTEHFAQCGVSSSDIEQLAQHIDGKELLSQRRLFNANNYASAPTRRKRTSPFVIA
jgi:serine/threonine-protein kinase HipA